MSLADQQWCPTSVQVTVLQARGLRIKGKSGTNDAYAVMQVGKEKYQTSVVEKSVAPVWKEEASFDLPPPLLLQGGGGGGGGGGGKERGTLHVQVLHRALVGPDKLLGQAVINLLQLSEDKTRSKTEWFKLLDKTGKPDKDRGEVFLDIQFMRNNMTASMFDLSAAGKSRSRLGKFKDKVRGKKKDLDSSSGVVPSLTQVLTDSEEEDANGGGEAGAGKDGKSKQHKRMSLFSPKSNLQRNMSQSMSVLPAKNSSLSGSQSSGLNVESSEGKKKFKFKIHKHSSSADGKDSTSGQQKQDQSNLCINGSHVYCEEAAPRTSRSGSSFSLSSSGRGSMEDVPENSSPSVNSLKAGRKYSPWMEEEEEKDESIEDLRTVEEEKARLEEEAIGKQQGELERLAKEKLRSDEEEKIRKEEEERQILEEKRRKLDEEQKRSREERIKKEEEMAQERRRQEEDQKLAEEQRRLKEEEERRVEEEKVRREQERADERRKKEQEQEKRQREEEERLKKEKIRAEEEEKARKEEHARLMAEKRLEEERIEAEEKFRKIEQERIKMEEEITRKEHEKLAKKRELEEEEKRREEQEKMQREEDRKIKEEEERLRRHELERLAKEKLRQDEEERRKIEERAKREEEEEMIQKEKMRQEEERIRQKEEEEERKRRQEELERLAKEKLRQEEEERRKVEEEQAKREEEERIQKEKMRREEEKAKKERMEEEKKEEERIKREEQEKLEEETRKREEEEGIKEEKHREEEMEKKRFEEEKNRIEMERIRREEKAEKERQEEEERKQEKLAKEKRDNQRKAGQKSVGPKVKLRVPVEITSTNPFDENFSSPEETPTSSEAKTDYQRCQSAVSSVESGSVSINEKDPINTQREKRAAPKPPGRNQPERPRQQEEETSAQHLSQINKQSKDKNVLTVSVAPQRSVQMIAPLNRSSKDSKNVQSATENDSTKEATTKNNKRPAPAIPCTAEDKLHRCVVEEDRAVHGLNPFEDGDDDENDHTVHDNVTTSGKTDPVCWPPVKSQSADRDAAKIKSSKILHAPLPPATPDTLSSSKISQTHDESKVSDDFGATAPSKACYPQEVKDYAQVQQNPNKESKPTVIVAGVKEEGPLASSRRLQPVKPLNPLEQQSDSEVKVGNDKATGLDRNGIQHKTNVGTGRSGPYSQLTREELIALLLKQESQLSERDKKISELEQYIDNLLVRVIEEKPSILLSMKVA
uniref:Trichohyalin n=1 Tax=Fundulus heteroclitus TaxID=8078 RepID=A0A3Q2PEZ1_FUNHE